MHSFQELRFQESQSQSRQLFPSRPSQRFPETSRDVLRPSSLSLFLCPSLSQSHSLARELMAAPRRSRGPWTLLTLLLPMS
jgi:hypothetical protein